MICPFCSCEIPPEIKGEITEVEYWCESACDMNTKIEAICPNCHKTFWAKWVETPHLWKIKHLAINRPNLTKDVIYSGFGEVEWAVESDGKLHFYLDISELPDVIEIECHVD